MLWSCLSILQVLLVRQMSEVSLMDVSKKHVLCIASLPGDYQLSSPMKPIISQAANGHMLYLKGGYCLGLVRGHGGYVSKKHLAQWNLLASLPGDYQLSSPLKPIISQAANGHMLYLKGGYCLGLVRGHGGYVSKKHLAQWNLLASLPGDYQLSSPMKPITSQAANGHMLYLKGGYCLGLVRGHGGYVSKKKHLVCS